MFPWQLCKFPFKFPFQLNENYVPKFGSNSLPTIPIASNRLLPTALHLTPEQIDDYKHIKSLTKTVNFPPRSSELRG